MRFFHQAARRAAVLLLCLSMLTGMLIPAFAATTDPATETPAHNLVYTDNQDENHDPIDKVWLTDDGVSGGCVFSSPSPRSPFSFFFFFFLPFFLLLLFF